MRIKMPLGTRMAIEIRQAWIERRLAVLGYAFE